MKAMHSMENSGLLRMREKLSRYNFTIKWSTGRAPIFDPEDEELTTSSTILRTNARNMTSSGHLYKTQTNK